PAAESCSPKKSSGGMSVFVGFVTLLTSAVSGADGAGGAAWPYTCNTYTCGAFRPPFLSTSPPHNEKDSHESGDQETGIEDRFLEGVQQLSARFPDSFNVLFNGVTHQPKSGGSDNREDCRQHHLRGFESEDGH